MSKVFPLNVVVCLDEDLSEDGLADGIVLGVELVEAVESVAVLRGEWKRCDADVGSVSLYIPFDSPHPLLTACMSKVSTLRSKAVRFMLSNTSMSVWPLPLSTCTISFGYFFMALLMKRRRCFWFMQDEA